MKRVLAFILVFTMLFALVACGSEPEYKKFLKEYEAWMDEYVELCKKYQANPTDASLLKEYTEMLGEVAEWSKRADEIKSELEDPKAAQEFAAEVARIAAKAANIA